MSISKSHAVALIVAITLAVVDLATASAAPRGVLTIQGRITDPSGQPVADVWVYTKGSRRLSSYSDQDGRYAISVPGATLREMVRAPFEIRVQARLKDWNMAHVDGAPELKFDMRIETDSLGGLALEVRSNESVVAETIAAAAVLDVNPSAVIEADFRAEPGLQVVDRDLEMNAFETVKLSGLTLAEVDPMRSRWLAREREREDERRMNELRRAELAAARAAQASGEDNETPAPDEAAEPVAAPIETFTAPAPAAATLPELGTSSDARTPVTARKEAKKKKKSERVKPPKRQARAEVDARDNSTWMPVAPAMAARAESVASTTRSIEAGTAPVVPVERVVAEVDRAVAQVDRAVQLVERAVAEVNKIASPGERVTTRPRWQPAGEAAPCECDVWGTVETARPLTERMKVMVTVEDVPHAQDQVELFMGSPRAIHLGKVPCGKHRIVLTTESKRRYKLAAPGDTLDCMRGNYQHVRLVLNEDVR